MNFYSKMILMTLMLLGLQVQAMNHQSTFSTPSRVGMFVASGLGLAAALHLGGPMFNQSRDCLEIAASWALAAASTVLLVKAYENKPFNPKKYINNIAIISMGGMYFGAAFSGRHGYNSHPMALAGFFCTAMGAIELTKQLQQQHN